MKSLLPLAAICALSISILPSRGADARPSTAPASPAEEIRQTAKAFVEAFHKEDAAALANFWTPDGDYTDLGGRVIRGRDAIRQDYEHLFAENQGLTLRIEVGSVRFPTPDTAIEDGVTSVMSPTASAPNRARYSNLLVKRDGKWLLSSVRESDYIPPNHQEHLRPLEWMIGEWMDTATNGHTAHVVFEWSPDHNYILSLRVVEVEGTFLDNGTQRIGWDPAKKQIRSWSFEPDGGFGESTWTADGTQGWTVKSSSTLQSGHPVTATTQVTRVNPDTITFQVKNQKVDGNPIPDSAVVTMKRVN